MRVHKLTILFVLLFSGLAFADYRIELVNGDPINVVWYEIKKEKGVIYYKERGKGPTKEVEMSNVVSVDEKIASEPQLYYEEKTIEHKPQPRQSNRNKSVGTDKNKERIDEYQEQRRKKSIKELDKKISALSELKHIYRSRISEAESKLYKLRRSKSKSNEGAIRSIKSYIENGKWEYNRVSNELKSLEDERSDLRFAPYK